MEPPEHPEAHTSAPLGDFDPLVVGRYAEHLAEVNKHRQVLAREDIFNADGALLVKRGTPIGEGVAGRIIDCKLRKPLEEQVRVSGEVDGARLNKDFLALLRRDASLRQLTARHGLALSLQGQCNLYQHYPILRQKMTVLAERLPDTYQRSLECALLCLLVARRQRLPEQTQSAVFLAGLVHDIGMLHIDPALAGSNDDFSPEQWRQVQAHAVIGYRILKTLPDLPAGTARAVLEHHERSDGTGYPSGKAGDQLSQSGQLIALVDSAIAMYHNRLELRGEHWADLSPMLQIAGQSYFYQNSAALVALLRSVDSDQSPARDGSDLTGAIERLLRRIQQASGCYSDMQQRLQLLTELPDDRDTRVIAQLYAHINTAVRGSGLLETSYRRWLEQVRDEQLGEAAGEVHEAHLMAEELIFHLQRLCRMMALCGARGDSPAADWPAALKPWLNSMAQVVQETREPGVRNVVSIS